MYRSFREYTAKISTANMLSTNADYFQHKIISWNINFVASHHQYKSFVEKLAKIVKNDVMWKYDVKNSILVT